jgi:hypothetical protein
MARGRAETEYAARALKIAFDSGANALAKNVRSPMPNAKPIVLVVSANL